MVSSSGFPMKGEVWWLDGVDVSVMAWIQTLCHCQCLPHQLIPQWSATVQCVSKPLCLLRLQSVCWCCCVVPLLPLCPIPILIGNCHFIVACTMSCVSVFGWFVCVVLRQVMEWGVDDAVCLAVHSQKRQHSTQPCLHVMVCINASGCMVCGR